MKINYSDDIYSKSPSGILLIGDVHGIMNRYCRIVQKHKGRTIQLGDFGFKEDHQWHMKHLDGNVNKVCFGNHDDPNYLNELHSLGDYSHLYDNEIMSVRGAMSTDRYLRTENRDWWSNEELTYNEMLNAYDSYVLNKPKIMLTHDCPQSIMEYVFGYKDRSTTRQGFQHMFDEHKPDMWVFGHYHKSINTVIDGTRFICLNELETMII